MRLAQPGLIWPFAGRRHVQTGPANIKAIQEADHPADRQVERIVIFAIDGVGNKQATVAWASAPPAEKATRFASAEALRWLERGISSYQDFMLGLALVLFALVIVWIARVPRPIGYLMGLLGLTYFVQGWLIGTSGFTPATTMPTAAGYSLLFVSMIWLLIVAWRRKESVQAAAA